MKNSILAYLRLMRFFHWKNNTGAVKIGGRFVEFGEPGMPDICMILPKSGRFVGIEVKRPLGPRGGANGSEQTPEQIGMQKKIEANGGVYILARSVPDVITELQRVGAGG